MPLPASAPLCPCGSGLTQVHCCEAPPTALAEVAAHRHLAPLEEDADRALAAGDTEAARALAIDILELAPGRTRALAVLYRIHRTTGAAPAAEALVRRIVQIDPNDFWATNELALLLMDKGALAEAELHARNAVRIAPEQAQSHYLMGMILTELHRPALGEYHYRRALELSGSREPAVLSNVAWCLKTQGKMAEARALYREALAADPPPFQTLLGAARLEEADRQLDAALALLDRAQAAFPANPTLMLTRAVTLGRKGDAPGAVALLDAMAARETRLGPAEILEKGRLLDRMGRHAEAFAAFEEGKRVLREVSGQHYAAEEAAETAARLRGFFTARRLATLPRATPRADRAQPLFILGFPRSGTTLVEQILTAHPRIDAGDELPFIHEIAGLLPRVLESPLAYPEALAELWMADHRDDLDTLRDHYLRRVDQLGIVSAGAAWFTDKMPLNEMHLGLIALLFPRAPLIHLIRHPLDVLLSVFSNLLTHGYCCAYALESIATHYALVADLIAHYRAEMELRYLPVRYEDLVDDQETQVRRMLDFVGEDFHPGCLAFHENRRYARTASYAQVSEKLYDRSRYRYRNYLDQLRPILPILEPVIARLGYTV